MPLVAGQPLSGEGLLTTKKMTEKMKPAATAQNMQKTYGFIPTNFQIRAGYRNAWLEENQPKLDSIKCHLMKGEYKEAERELEHVRLYYDPARVALYKMHAYHLDGKIPNPSWLLHLIRNSAADGHIPSMHLLTKMLMSGTSVDNASEAELWKRRADILDPGHVWDRELLNYKIAPTQMLAEDVLNALDEGSVPFYDAYEAAIKATINLIPPCSESFFTEPVGGLYYKELIARTAVSLHERKLKQAKRLFERASEYDHLAAKIYLAKFYYGQGKKEKFFDCVKYGASYDIIPCMFTTSACYRYGYGVERSDDFADAWYWMACQYDIDNRGLKEAILLHV